MRWVHWTWKMTGLLGLLGLFAGAVSSLLGIGAGIIIVPALSYAWDKFYDAPQKMAQGTALALMIPMAVAGSLRYYFCAEASNWRIAVPVYVYGLVSSAVIVAIPLLFAHYTQHTNVLGHVDWHTAAMLSLTAVAGVVWLGAPLANVLPTETLRHVFGIMTIIIGIRMLGWHMVLYNLCAGKGG